MWPEIVIRPKRNGFEQFGTKSKVVSVGSLQQFQKQHINSIDISNTVYSLRADQLVNLIPIAVFVRFERKVK